jgi:hypothetical protein
MDRIRKMFQTHPSPASDAGDEAFALVTAAAECTLRLHHLRRCLPGGVGPGVAARVHPEQPGLRRHLPGHRPADLPARRAGSRALRAQLEACATACRACADECDEARRQCTSTAASAPSVPRLRRRLRPHEAGAGGLIPVDRPRPPRLRGTIRRVSSARRSGPRRAAGSGWPPGGCGGAASSASRPDGRPRRRRASSSASRRPRGAPRRAARPPGRPRRRRGWGA